MQKSETIRTSAFLLFVFIDIQVGIPILPLPITTSPLTPILLACPLMPQPRIIPRKRPSTASTLIRPNQIMLLARSIMPIQFRLALIRLSTRLAFEFLIARARTHRPSSPPSSAASSSRRSGVIAQRVLVVARSGNRGTDRGPR